MRWSKSAKILPLILSAASYVELRLAREMQRARFFVSEPLKTKPAVLGENFTARRSGPAC